MGEPGSRRAGDDADDQQNDVADGTDRVIVPREVPVVEVEDFAAFR